MTGDTGMFRRRDLDLPHSFPVHEPDSLAPARLVFIGIAVLVVDVPVREREDGEINNS